jgi:hypothetical protein
MLSPEGWRRTRFSSPVLFSQEAGIGKRREAHASVNEVSGGHGLARMGGRHENRDDHLSTMEP